jgi:DNA-binding NtrC family response regulator
MSKCVVVREDEQDLVDLVRELLEDADFSVTHVTTVEDLFIEVARRLPCVALIDGTSPSSFDLWWAGPVLEDLGVPAIAFTAHASARQEFEAGKPGYVGVVSKPFDADEFIDLVNSICWEEKHAAAS